QLGAFLVAREVVLEWLQPRRQLGAGPAAGFEGARVPLPPLRVDALELPLASRPIQVLPDETWMPFGDAAGLFGGRLRSEVALGRLRVADSECGQHLAHGGLLSQRRRINAAGSGFKALGFRIELRPFPLQLLHLGSNVGCPALEFLLRLSGCPQVPAQLLDL